MLPRVPVFLVILTRRSRSTRIQRRKMETRMAPLSTVHGASLSLSPSISFPVSRRFLHFFFFPGRTPPTRHLVYFARQPADTRTFVSNLEFNGILLPAALSCLHGFPRAACTPEDYLFNSGPASISPRALPSSSRVSSRSPVDADVTRNAM